MSDTDWEMEEEGRREEIDRLMARLVEIQGEVVGIERRLGELARGGVAVSSGYGGRAYN